jgi:hypothetical protein
MTSKQQEAAKAATSGRIDEKAIAEVKKGMTDYEDRVAGGKMVSEHDAAKQEISKLTEEVAALGKHEKDLKNQLGNINLVASGGSTSEVDRINKELQEVAVEKEAKSTAINAQTTKIKEATHSAQAKAVVRSNEKLKMAAAKLHGLSDSKYLTEPQIEKFLDTDEGADAAMRSLSDRAVKAAEALENKRKELGGGKGIKLSAVAGENAETLVTSRWANLPSSLGATTSEAGAGIAQKARELTMGKKDLQASLKKFIAENPELKTETTPPPPAAPKP